MASNEIDILDTSEPDDGHNGKLLLNKMFSNDLVFDTLVTFLNASDLKALSQTCRYLLAKVRDNKKFKDNLKFIVTKETTKAKVLGKQFRPNWKNVAIDMSSINRKLLPSFNKMVRIATSISVNDGLFNNFAAEDKAENERRMNLYMSKLLAKSSKMTSLSIEYSILEKKLSFLSGNNDEIIESVPSGLVESKLLEAKDAQKNIGNLEKLEILSGKECDRWVTYDGKGAETPFINNLTNLSNIPMKLKSLTFGKVDFWAGDTVKISDFFTGVGTLIKNNCHTLTELNLHNRVWYLEEMKTVICPNLRSLTLSANKDCGETVEMFLENHPHLESLVIQFKMGFPVSVIHTLREKNLISRLKKLIFKCSSFDGSKSIDFSFLSTLTNLKEFHIFQPRSFLGENETQTTCNHIMTSLPNSVKKINLRGLETGWEGNIPASIISSLEKFNLTQLSLMRSDNSLNSDAILHFIYTHMPNLRVLEFSHCTNLTNFGISGINHNLENTGVSIRNLKVLRKLKIRECREITPICFRDNIAFTDLTDLDLGTPNFIEKAIIMSLVSRERNPALETLTINYNLEELELNELKEINPRFRALQGVIEDWANDESDSDAEPVDDDDFSGFSGGDWDDDDDDDDDFDGFDGHFGNLGYYDGENYYPGEADFSDDDLYEV